MQHQRTNQSRDHVDSVRFARVVSIATIFFISTTNIAIGQLFCFLVKRTANQSPTSNCPQLVNHSHYLNLNKRSI